MTDNAADPVESDTNSDGTHTDTDPTPVGVKLGSSRTVLVYRDDDGGRETVQTLSCLAVPDNPESGDARVHYGEAAVRQFPERTEYVLQSGLPTDATRAKQTERFFDQLCADHGLPEDSAVVYAIPSVRDGCGLANLDTMVGQSAVGETLTRAYPESLCAAIPALGTGVDAIDQIFVAIDLGATKLEASAYRHGDRYTPLSTPAVAANDVDRVIADAIEDESGGAVTLDAETAREYKETHADFDAYEPFSATVERPDGSTREFTVESGLMDPLDAYLDAVVEELGNRFFSRLANERMKTYQLALTRPLVVTGGMACIPGLADELATRLGEELDRDVTAVTADEPDVAAAEGAYRIAERLTVTD